MFCLDLSCHQFLPPWLSPSCSDLAQDLPAGGASSGPVDSVLLGARGSRSSWLAEMGGDLEKELLEDVMPGSQELAFAQHIPGFFLWGSC